ncbi:DNA polymerase III subunit epsilon [Pararhizobium sp. A13]|uniref:DNA polymerase III subunit epsilon n=1 Tax=Pararhizobium sp. A13 TaxID=3133975 RepID=UPI00324BED4C
MTGVVYIVTDIEADGPYPEDNSMLSIASVAIDATGKILDHFSANLIERENAKQDSGTMHWWGHNDDAWSKLQVGRGEPGKCLALWCDWVLTHAGIKVFAAHPLAFDGHWVDWNIKYFLGRRLFDRPREPGLCAGSGLDIISLLMGKLGWNYQECRRENYRDAWLGNIPHDHSALSDARGYAHLLGLLLTRDRAELLSM